MIVLYKILRYDPTVTITKEVFKSETANFYVREGGSRVAKDGQNYIYLESWKDARDTLIRRAEIAIRNDTHTLNMLKRMKAP